jgi:hypothetical protein
VINASVAQMNGLPESLNGTVTEGLVGTCDVGPSFVSTVQMTNVDDVLDAWSDFSPLSTLQAVRSGTEEMRS